MNIYIDIESLPNTDTWVKEDIAAHISPPGNMKKAETIAKWEAEEKQKVVDEKIAKTSLDTSLANVLCMCIAIDDQLPISFTGTEKEIISNFFDVFAMEKRVTLIGHNITGFDLPLLYHRGIANGVKIPDGFPKPTDKPWEMNIVDTMTLWCGIRDHISLDRLAKILGLKGKGKYTGADVYPLYLEGKIDDIIEYCTDDVNLVRQVHLRIQQCL